MGNNGYIYALDMVGDPAEGYPVNTGYLSKSALAVSDIDSDDDLDIIAGNYSGISVTDLKGAAQDVHWAMHRGSADRRGSSTFLISSVENPDIVESFELSGNYPNPFNPSTTIKFTVGSDAPLTVKLYSLNGKLVSTRQISNLSIGLNEIDLDMSNFASGIYFYKLAAKSQKLKANSLLLRINRIYLFLLLKKIAKQLSCKCTKPTCKSSNN